jgi:anti-anti-sigma factor
MNPWRWDAAGMEIFGSGGLDITSPRQDSVRLLLFGEFDRVNIDDLEAAMFDALRPGVRFVDLDLTAVTFVDAGVLTALVRFQQEIDDRLGRLRVYTSRSIHRTLAISGLAQLFELIDEAEKYADAPVAVS